MGPHGLNKHAWHWERGHQILWVEQYMLPKQKHTFCSSFPLVSVLVDVLPVPCPRITAQQLSEAQSRGKWRMEDEWCNRGLNEKETVYVWYVPGGASEHGKKRLQVMLLVLSMCYSSYSLLEMWMRSYFFNKACLNITLCMKFLQKQCIVPACMWGIDRKTLSLLSKHRLRKAIALCSFITLLFVHV